MSIYSRTKINQVLHEVLSSSNIDSDLDKQCIQRNFNDGDLEKYKHRLKAIGFESINGPVLDAGCGFGQWSIVLRDLNSKVIGTKAGGIVGLGFCNGTEEVGTITNCSNTLTISGSQSGGNRSQSIFSHNL